MPDEAPEPGLCQLRLQELLLGYLEEAEAPSWPGADGLTVQDVLRTYPVYEAAGRVPDRQELLRRHPDLREALLTFFPDRDRAGQTPRS
jgi:hypothetical protein